MVESIRRPAAAFTGRLEPRRIKPAADRQVDVTRRRHGDAARYTARGSREAFACGHLQLERREDGSDRDGQFGSGEGSADAATVPAAEWSVFERRYSLVEEPFRNESVGFRPDRRIEMQRVQGDTDDAAGRVLDAVDAQRAGEPPEHDGHRGVHPLTFFYDRRKERQ